MLVFGKGRRDAPGRAATRGWRTCCPRRYALDDEASLRQRHFSRLDATAVTAIEDVHTNGLP
jgi:hypothetical protein